MRFVLLNEEFYGKTFSPPLDLWSPVRLTVNKFGNIYRSNLGITAACATKEAIRAKFWIFALKITKYLTNNIT